MRPRFRRVNKTRIKRIPIVSFNNRSILLDRRKSFNKWRSNFLLISKEVLVISYNLRITIRLFLRIISSEIVSLVLK